MNWVIYLRIFLGSLDIFSFYVSRVNEVKIQYGNEKSVTEEPDKYSTSLSNAFKTVYTIIVDKEVRPTFESIAANLKYKPDDKPHDKQAEKVKEKSDKNHSMSNHFSYCNSGLICFLLYCTYLMKY